MAGRAARGAEPVTLDRIRAAARATHDVARPTPVLSSRGISERAGGTVVLKAENLQRTGSFKLRGALAKIAALGEDGCRAGVVAGSAGNHAQSLAYAARARGVPCEVFMPSSASIAKAEATSNLGATVHLTPGAVDESIAAAEARAEDGGLAFVHPFDDPDVIAGQGTLGLELVEEVPDLARVLVPVGGGGLASGVAIAVKSLRPQVEVIGIRVELPPSALTIADGIAVKHPGELTGALLERWLDDRVTVSEEAVAEAMVMLLERAKLVVEGAGAVGVAALLSHQAEATPRGATVAILSGGNVDAGLLAAIARRAETAAGRRLVVLTRVSDHPGSLAKLLATVAEANANLVTVEHMREGLDLHVRETGIQLVLETRGARHAEEVLRAIAQAGYEARIVQ